MHKNSRGIAVILPILLVLLILGVVGYIVYNNIQINQRIVPPKASPDVQNTTVPNNKQEINSNEDVVFKEINELTVRTYPSPTGLYSYTIQNVEVGKCISILNMPHGARLETTDIFDSPTIECIDGMFGVHTRSYIGWSGDHHLLLEMEPGIINVINAQDGTSKLFEYDKDTLLNIGKNSPQDTVMFNVSSTPDWSNKFVLINTNTNDTIKEIEFSMESTSAYYDHVNKGYLFIATNWHNEKDDNDVYWQYIETKIYFVADGSEEKKLILSNEPVEVFGRGCGPMFLQSEPGEIIINTGGCLGLDEDKYSDDGLVHIKLE